MAMHLIEVLDQAAAAVLEAGELISRAWGHPGEVRHKGRIDLVTATDVAVEELLKTRLAPLIPDATFLAEETSAKAGLGQSTWIIDPVDGTTNFAHGLPFVATSVALWQDGDLRLGLINLPILGELFTAARGRGALRNGEPIQVSRTTAVQESLVATGFPYNTRKYLEGTLDHLGRMLLETQGIRRPGAAALDLAYVACGRFDGFYENALNPWDTAAGVLLVEEAGGRVSGFNAATSYVLGADEILASNGLLHEDLSRLLLEPAP